MNLSRRNVYILVATAVLLLAAFARTWQLTRLDFWIDEDWTVWFSVLDASPLDTVQRIAADVHPPLYFVAVNLWIGVAGISEQAIRLLSVWPSLLAVAFVIRLGRDWFGRGGGVLSGLVLAVSMYHIWFAQEARHYALLTMFAALSMLLYTRWLKHSGWRWAVAWILANAIMLWSHYLGVFVIGVQGLHLLITNRKRLGQFILMGIGMIVLFAPWIPKFLDQIGNEATHNASGLGQTLPTTWANIWQQFDYMTSGQPLLYIVLLLIAAWGTWNTVRQSNVGAQHDVPLLQPLHKREHILLAWLWAFLPVALIFAVNPVFRLYNTRNVLLIMPGFALVIGFGLAWLFNISRRGVWQYARRYAPTIAIGLTAAVLILSPQVTQSHRPAITDEKPVRDVMQAIAAHYQPGDAIFIDPDCVGCYNPHEWEYYERLLIGETVPIFRWQVTPVGEPTGILSVTADWPRPASTTRHLTLPPRVWYVSDLRDRDESSLAFIADDRREMASGGIYELTGQLFIRPPGPHFTFGDDQTVHLRGAQFPTSAAPGETVQVRLWWQTEQSLDADYSVSVRLETADGSLITQHDGGPTEVFQGDAYEWPASGWEPGAFILDDHFLALPQDLAPGEYTVHVIFYQWWDEARWEVYDQDGNAVGDSVAVGTINITMPSSP